MTTGIFKFKFILCTLIVFIINIIIKYDRIDYTVTNVPNIKLRTGIASLFADEIGFMLQHSRYDDPCEWCSCRTNNDALPRLLRIYYG